MSSSFAEFQPLAEVPRSQSHTQQDAVKFILSLSRALHTYGYDANQLEELMGEVSHRLGVIAQFFSTPTSIFVSFGPQDEQRTFLMRVEPGEQNLGKLAQLDEVTTEIVDGRLTPARGARRVAEIVAAPPAYGEGLTTVAFGVASGAGARFLGGGLREVAVAAVIGLVIGLLALGASRVRSLGRVFEPLSAFLAAAIATAGATLFRPMSTFTATLAGLIVLIPGFTLTVSLKELSTRHLSSGIARLSSAFMVFLVIIFGVALGNNLMGRLLGSVPAEAPAALPAWTLFVALPIVPLAFVVLLRAQPRDAGWIIASGVLAFLGSRLGSEALGNELGAFIGALIVGAASNAYARIRKRPEMVTLVPGVLLLVPGSIGYRSLAALLDREVVSGVETAFSMILIAVALVAGLLMANIIVPARARV